MNYQDKIKFAKLAAESLEDGKTMDYVKQQLKDEVIYEKDILNIVSSSKRILLEKYEHLVSEKLACDEDLSTINGWNKVDEEVKLFILDSVKQNIKAKNKKELIAEVELPDNWNSVYNPTRLFAATSFIISTIAVKERLLQSYEPVLLKLLVISMVITSIIYWYYLSIIKNYILKNNPNQTYLSIMEIIGYINITLVIIFFYYICNESNYWFPLLIVKILAVIYAVFIFKLLKIRKTNFIANIYINIR